MIALPFLPEEGSALLELVLILVVLSGCRRDDSFQKLDRGVKLKRFRRSVQSDLEHVRRATRHQLDNIRERLTTYEERMAKLQVRHKRLNDRVTTLQTKLKEQLLVAKEARAGGANPGAPGVIGAGVSSEPAAGSSPSGESGRERETVRQSTAGEPDKPTKRADRIWQQLGRTDLDVSALENRIRGNVDAVSDRIVRGLFDTNQTRRRNAERLMVEIGPEPFRDRLLTLLRTPRYTLRLIQVVGQLHLTAAKERLRELQKKNDPDTKYYATRALVEVGDADAVSDLIGYLAGSEGDALYRMDAHMVLKKVMNRDFGHPSAAVASRRENRRKEVDWRNWWNAYRKKLRWNPGTKRYSLKAGTASPVTVQPHHSE